MDWTSIDWPEVIKNVAAFLGLLGIGGAATVGVRTQYRKIKAVNAEVEDQAIKDEWKELAQVRAEKVEHLESEIQELRQEGHELRERLAKLEGAYEALQNMKEDRIADRVVELINATGGLRNVQ